MLRSRLRADDGFSLVEILVAILIMGILVAIALPVFISQRSKAQDTHAKTAATTAAKAMAVWQTDNSTFAGAAPEDLVRIEPALGQARGLAVISDTRTFTVTVDSAAGGAYSLERLSDGEVVRGCTQPGEGSCAADADARGNRW
jgi:prepilin-type N-terminal cleavage/methylation domain-containing protein